MSKLSILIFIIAITLSCCSNDGQYSNPNEFPELYNVVKIVRDQMADLGFPIDLDEIELDIKDAQEMASIFAKISYESRLENKAYSPMGPVMSIKEREQTDRIFTRLAFYDPNSKTLIFRDGALGELTYGYLAHELAHVYQDQKWNFNDVWQSYLEKPSQELFNITQYMIEGHAELVRQTYEQRGAKDKRSKTALSTSLGKILDNDCATCATNDSILDLPYVLGLRFMVHQYRHGGWPSVEALFKNLPKSSEQILHPNKWNRDNPVSVALPAWQNSDAKAELVMEGSLGEAYLLSKLLGMNVKDEQAFQASSGWDGDLAQHYQLEDGRKALVWRLVFDRPLDAQQLESALEKFAKPGDLFRIGRVLDWIITDSPELRKRLRIFLSKNPFNKASESGDEKTTIEQEISITNDAKSLYSPYFYPKVLLGPNA